jgi:hypothetical protein
LQLPSNAWSSPVLLRRELIRAQALVGWPALAFVFLLAIMVGPLSCPHKDDPSRSKDELPASAGDGTFTSRTPSGPFPFTHPGKGKPRLAYPRRAGLLKISLSGNPFGMNEASAGSRLARLARWDPAGMRQQRK